MSGKSKRKGIFYLVVAMVIILILLCLPFAVSAQDVVNPKCGMGNTIPTSFENHVEFSTTWEDGSPTGEYPFDFGDGSPNYVLTGMEGSSLFSHDFPIVMGEVVTYYVGFSVYNDTYPDSANCMNSVIIDYRQPEYKVFLPIISKAISPPSCLIAISEQNLNHLVFDVTWQDAGIGVHQIQFGDGSYTEQFSGSSGSGQTWHDYAYPGGNFIITMKLDGGGSCFTKVLVDWP